MIWGENPLFSETSIDMDTIYNGKMIRGSSTSHITLRSSQADKNHPGDASVTNKKQLPGHIQPMTLEYSRIFGRSPTSPFNRVTTNDHKKRSR